LSTPTNSSLFAIFFRGIWPMPLSLLNHSALSLFAQRTRIPTSARSIGFCAIWVCISSSSNEPSWSGFFKNSRSHWSLFIAIQLRHQMNSQPCFHITYAPWKFRKHTVQGTIKKEAVRSEFDTSTPRNISECKKKRRETV
jgi:hypothetical protein